MKLLLNCFLLLWVALTSCAQKTEVLPASQPHFDSIPVAKPLTPIIKEISGISGSKTMAQHLWGHEDSGNPPQLYLIKQDGTVQKKVFLKGAVNRDWEDIARAGDDLYIADIGDNNRAFTEYVIYKFREPAADADTVDHFEKIRFKYPDGAYDAEALLVEPATKDIFIITKRNTPSLLFKIAFPYSFTEINSAVKVGTLTYGGVVSAALSPDAKEILVKTYAALYYYNRNSQPIEATLQTKPTALSYKAEPQGEAVTFAPDNSGFFTLSEKAFSSAVNLYFYKRR